MKIIKIQLLSHNLVKAKDFYGNVLSLPLKTEMEGKISFQAGSSELEFVGEIQTDIPTLNYHFAFNIPHNQINEAKNWLVRKGIQLLSFDNQEIIPFPNWNAQALYFLDSLGNIVEFIARQDLYNASKEKFSAQSIESISEIGLPVPEIQPVFEQLNQFVELPMYSKISNLTSFCAAGSPAGLFIIVPLNRAWFPTQIINGVFPLQIWVQTEILPKIDFQLNNLPYQVYVI